MRQSQCGIGELEIVVDKEVQIQGSWTISVFPYSSVGTLNVEQGLEQFMGGQGSFHLRHRIDEIRLVEAPYRSAPVKRGPHDQAA
jgi:hypothetical protein